MYARSPRAAGPRAEGIHIRQNTRACVTTNMLYFQHSKICPNLMLIFPSAYIAITIVGANFNVVSMTFCLVKVLIMSFVYCFI